MDQSLAVKYFQTNSKSQEKYAEYFFLKDIILEAALIGETINVSRSDFDAFGFDILLGRNDTFVLVQLKSFSDTTRSWDVHKSILQSESGRVILVHLFIKEDKMTKDKIIVPKYYLFKRENTAKALGRKPLVKNPKKCKTNWGDYKEITGNLLTVFMP